MSSRRLCRRAGRRQELQSMTSQIASRIFCSTSASVPRTRAPAASLCPPPPNFWQIAETSTASLFERMLTRTLPSIQFLEKNRNDHSFDRAQMVDQAFVVLRLDLEIGRDFQAEAEAGDFSGRFETHRAEQFPEQLGAAARVVFVKKLADAPDLHPAPAPARSRKSARWCSRKHCRGW